MSFWGAITGRKANQTSSGGSSDEFRDTAPTTVMQASPYGGPTNDDVSSFINTPSAYDPSSLHPLAGLNQDTLDYLSLDESALSDIPGSQSLLPSRGWSDDLCYGTGVSYLAALSIGGAWGLAEGLNRLPSTAPPQAATQLCPQRHHQTWTIFGQLSWCRCDDVQRCQQHNRICSWQTRFI